MSTLQTRLQDPDYINWVKAGLCLIHTKSGLEEFAETASNSLHQSILKKIIPKFASAAQPVCGVNIASKQLIAICAHPYCQNFISEVINIGFDPNHAFTVNHGNLGNCDIGQWHSHHWQVAKLFMNKGQGPTHVHPRETDMSGIINFLSHCKIPRNAVTNIGFFDKVRNARNSTMHSAVMKLSGGDLQTYAQSMIDLLSDPGVAQFTTAQDAVKEIQSIINAADFKITLEDERKVIDDLSAEIRTLAEEIRQEVDAVAQKGDAERQSINDKIHGVIRMVISLKDRLEKITDTQCQMKDKVTILTDQLKDLRAFEIKLNDIEQQQQKLAKQQEACQQTIEAHDKALSNLTTSQKACHKTVGELKTQQSDLWTELDTSRTKTKQDIEEVKTMQEDYQRKTNQRFDDLTTTVDPIPTDEDKKRLREYLQNIYTDSDYSTVTPLPDWVGIHVRDIFTPVILVGDRKGHKKQRLESYKELFHKEGVKQKKIMLLGEAGAGKTTFCQHLVDVWSNPSSRRQFDDVDIIKQFQFLFYISCRFAESHETVFNMIECQLFDDQNSELRDIACSVLRHNADSCLILMDGFDELQRSAQAKTGKRGDITGMPSLTNIQNCALVTTSRPWKFLSIPDKEQEKFRCLELDGIKNMAELVETIFQEHQIENPAISCLIFLHVIEKRGMTELMKFPIMLLFAIDVWVEKGSLPKSVSLCYINMIELTVSRFARKRVEANIEKSNTIVEKLLHKYSQSSKCLPKPFSNFAGLRQHAGLLLSLGHLAYDLLIQPNEQILVIQRNVCERYKLNDSDESLKYCLDLGLLVKIETTVKGFKQKENFQFCHKTYQEFFAALWLSYIYTKEGSQEMSHIQSCIKSYTDLNNHSVLIQFLCGLCPEAGAELWKYVAQNDNIEIKYTNRNKVQNQVLRAVKEAQDCCDHQGVQVYYCIRNADIDIYTTDEDVSLLCKMIQNNSCYLKHLRVWGTCLSSSQYHSLLRSASSAIELELLVLENISCKSNDSSEDLPVLDLSKHCRLQKLLLKTISISGLVLPSQEGSRLSELYLDNLVLPHDNLVNLCSSLSSRTRIINLRLTSLSCSQHQDSCCPAVLDLHNHCGLLTLSLDEISISGLVLPSQEGSRLRELYLYNLVLSHDNLVNLCSSLSSWTELKTLITKSVSCSQHQDSCYAAVLDLRNQCRLYRLTLDEISISGLVLPSQEGSRLRKLYLNNQVLPHDNLVNICSSLSSRSEIEVMGLTSLSCSQHQDGCSLPVLDLSNHCRLQDLFLKKISISGLVLPSQEGSRLRELYLNNLVLSHDNLVNICSSLSSRTRIINLRLTSLSCIQHQNGCSLSVLDLHSHCRLRWLTLDKIAISGLVLPSQEGSRLRELYLNNLVLSHDNLVGLCCAISSLSSIEILQLTHVRCIEHDGSCDVPTLNLPTQETDNADKEQIPDIDVLSLSGLDKLKLPIMPCSKTSDACRFTVLNLQKHRNLMVLKLDSSSISGIFLPSHDRIYILSDLVLSHDSLEQLPRSLSSLSAGVRRHIVNLSCSDHGGSCELPSLNHPDSELDNMGIYEMLYISDDDSDSDGSESD